MSKQLLVLFEFEEHQVKDLKETAADYEVIFSIAEADPEKLEIIVGWRDEVTPLVAHKNSNVKWIQFPYAGINTLPLELFDEKGIILSNGSGIHSAAGSESVMGLILSYTRNIVTSVKNQMQEQWNNVENLYELTGKTMMIVGAGHIGIQLGKVAKGFDMHTIGINRSGKKIPHMDEQYTQDRLEDVVHKADIIVNILPATEETHHVFNEKLFSEMKDETIFINIGRGETVDTLAMMDALDNDKLLFAGLDVFEEEPLPSGHPLWSHEKVVVTPHIAGRVENYPNHFYPIFKRNLVSYLKSYEVVENVVELRSGY